MLTKRLSIAAAIVVLGIAAACSSNSSGPSTVFPQPGGNVTGQPFTLTPVGGYSATVSISGPSGASPAPLTVTMNTSAPSGAPALSLKKRTPQAAASPVPQVYITVTAGSGGATLYSLSNLQVTLPAAVPNGESLYLGYYDGTTWQPIFKAATLVSGTTYTFAGGVLNPSIVLAAGQSAYFVVYESTIQIGPTPTPAPTATPTPEGQANFILNGNFETGGLFPWVACSYAHTPYAAAINPSPAPAASASQPPTSEGSPSPVISGGQLSQFVSVTPPPNNFNPNNLSTPSNLGSYSALTGSLNAQINATTGICQTVVVPPAASLTFWVYEGGTAYNFYNGDQEAQILDSTGTNVVQTLFVELNCYYDSTNFPSEPAYAASGCFPSAYGGTSAYTDWQGGFWTERGPYDLSSLAGQTVTLFLGTWTNQTHAGPTSYANFMFVDNVDLAGTGTAPTIAPSPSPTPMATISATIQGGARR